MLDKYHFGNSLQAVALSEHLNKWCVEFPKHRSLQRRVNIRIDNFFGKVNAITRVHAHTDYISEQFKTTNTLFSKGVRDKILWDLLYQSNRATDVIFDTMSEKIISSYPDQPEILDTLASIKGEVKKVCKMRVLDICK
jgi:hypothetical protein